MIEVPLWDINVVCRGLVGSRLTSLSVSAADFYSKERLFSGFKSHPEVCTQVKDLQIENICTVSAWLVKFLAKLKGLEKLEMVFRLSYRSGDLLIQPGDLFHLKCGSSVAPSKPRNCFEASSSRARSCTT
jgi:hypothetical protein